MKNKRGMMAHLLKQMDEPAAPETQPTTPAAGKTESKKASKPAFRPRAAKRAKDEAPAASAQSLEKMTIKLEPVVRKQILAESFRRKSEGAPNWQIQEIVSEAVNKYLGSN